MSYALMTNIMTLAAIKKADYRLYEFVWLNSPFSQATSYA
jgi:hypothetical protein